MKEHDTEKGWYYKEGENKQGYFLALVNARGSCSMRIFDSNDGAFLVKEYKKNCNYQVGFPEFLKGAISLYISKQPNLEVECRHRLPSYVLAELRQQVLGRRGT